MSNLMDFKLILDQAKKELKLAARAQTTESLSYEEAKNVYKNAYYEYISQMNKFCEKNNIRMKFNPQCCDANQYDR